MLFLYIVLLIGYGTLIRFFYKERKYIVTALWILIFICVLYLMIEIYYAGYLI